MKIKINEYYNENCDSCGDIIKNKEKFFSFNIEIPDYEFYGCMIEREIVICINCVKNSNKEL